MREAVHKTTKKRVAIKAVKKSQLSSEELDLARREIEVLKCCQHPNIVRLLDVFENMKYIYIVMELLTGGDLYSYLEKRDFNIPEEQAYRILYSLASSLHYIHSYGIIHRDLKLENVIVAGNLDDSNVKLLDFGLSMVGGPNQTSKDLLGTMGYMAPEVLLKQSYNKSVDVWSLGVIAYILLSGAAPFANENDTKEDIIK